MLWEFLICNTHHCRNSSYRRMKCWTAKMLSFKSFQIERTVYICSFYTIFTSTVFSHCTSCFPNYRIWYMLIFEMSQIAIKVLTIDLFITIMGLTDKLKKKHYIADSKNVRCKFIIVMKSTLLFAKKPSVDCCANFSNSFLHYFLYISRAGNIKASRDSSVFALLSLEVTFILSILAL